MFIDKFAPSMRGDLKITEIDLLSGNESVVVDEKNIIVKTGVNTIPKALSPKVMTGGKLGVIKFGDDVGNGTQQNPEPPKYEDSSSSQNVIYTVPQNKMNYTLDGGSLILSISMNGADIVGDRDFIRYTSAAIYTDTGDMFSYKRFPFRVFSKHVRVNIEWIITADNMEHGGGEVCPPLPFVTGVSIEAPQLTLEQDSTITLRGFEKMSDGVLRVVPNGSKWTTNNQNITLSSGNNGQIVLTGQNVGSTYLTLSSGNYIDSRLINVIEKYIPKSLSIIPPEDIEDVGVGDEILFKLEYTVGGEATDVSNSAAWTTSSNLSIISKTKDGLLVKVVQEGASYVSAEYEGITTQYTFEVLPELRVTNIEITPLGNTRFDVGETLDITPMIYYNDGTSRLATIKDRWVYDTRALKLEEYGTVGNLRITALYRGDWNIRLYEGGVEGRLDVKVSFPLEVEDAYTLPQTPLYVIPDVHTDLTVMGRMNEGDDSYIDHFYITSESDKMVIEEDGLIVEGDGEYNLRVKIDKLDKKLPVISTTMTTDPLKLTLCDCDGVGSGTIKIEMVNPKSSGVYIDHNGVTRRFYDESNEVEIDYFPEDALDIYGGVEKLIITGGVKSIDGWGDFDCDGYEIESQALIKVPYVAPAVQTMDRMFKGCTRFNQNLNAWCVTDFPDLPEGFDGGCVSWIEPRPEWGTCPNPKEIYKIVVTPSSDIELKVGETTTLTVYGFNRLDERIGLDSGEFEFEFVDSVIFIETDEASDEVEIEALTVGESEFKVTTDTREKVINVKVE